MVFEELPIGQTKTNTPYAISNIDILTLYIAFDE